MARAKKMTASVYIPINGKNELWYKIDEDGNTEWFLPEDVTDPIKDKMLENIGRNMSRYMLSNPQSALWDD